MARVILYLQKLVGSASLRQRILHDPEGELRRLGLPACRVELAGNAAKAPAHRP